MGRWPCQPHPQPPAHHPPPAWGTPLPCTEEHKQPCQTSRRTQPAWNIQNTGSGGTGTGRPDAGPVRREKVQALLPPFPDRFPRAPADEGRGGGGAPPVPGPQGPPYPPAPHPGGPPSHPNQVAWGCPGFWREDQPTAPLQAQPGSCWGLRGDPGPPRSCGTKAGRGACCHAGAARSHGPPPRPRRTTPGTISIGGGGWGLATLTQPTFGFQERKKDRVCYFPATHSSFLCDVCTVRHTRYEKYIHASLMRPVSFTWTGEVHVQGLPPTSLFSPSPPRPRGGNAWCPQPSHLAARALRENQPGLREPGPPASPQRPPAGGPHLCYLCPRNAPCLTQLCSRTFSESLCRSHQEQKERPLPLGSGKHQKGHQGAERMPAASLPPTPSCA